MTLDPTSDRPAGRGLIDGIVAGLAGIPPGHLWPGFDPASLPLAVALVALVPEPSTWLIHHVGDDGYERCGDVVDGTPLFHHSGLDERLVANGTADIGGQLTATILAEDGLDPCRYVVALAAHELFHVFQAGRYPGCGANEAAQLTYPWDDPVNLARAVSEMALLDRAVATTDDRGCRRLATRTLAARRQRFRRLPADARAYEDGIELAEGSARAVEERAAQTLGWPLPALATRDGIDVRRRGYRTGAGWCALLDRLAGPDWPLVMPDDPDSPPPVLTDLLSTVVGQATDPVDDIGWQDQIEAATTAVAIEADRRTERLAVLLAAATLTVVIRGRSGSPLRVVGFDPMNLTPIRGGLVLHERYLALTAGDTRITIQNLRSLTTASGDHLLFSGIERVEIPVTAFPADHAPWDAASLARLGVRIDGPFSVQPTSPNEIKIVIGDRP